MQTFLPFPHFAQSAAVLDRQRLGKQRIETLQLINANLGRSKGGWVNHPAAVMWRGYESALATYGLYICSEWRTRGYDPGVTEPRMRRAWEHLRRPRRRIAMPPWLGDPDLHRAYRKLLVWKAPDHYRPIFTDIERTPRSQPNIPWPGES